MRIRIGSNAGPEQSDQFDHVLFGHSVIAVQKDIQKILGGAEKTAERLTAPGKQLTGAVVDGDGATFEKKIQTGREFSVFCITHLIEMR